MQYVCAHVFAQGMVLVSYKLSSNVLELVGMHAWPIG